MSYDRSEISKHDIETAINNTKSMIAAANYMGVSRDRFKRYAIKYGLFNPNQSGKGIKKSKYHDEEIFSNSLKKISPTLLIKRLKEKREWKCECCGISEWNGEKLSLEVHHIDGNRFNNDLSNLQILCPNCHSLTENWRSRNLKGYNKKTPKVTDDELLNALKNHNSIFSALQSLGLAGGSNYNRVYELIKK